MARAEFSERHYELAINLELLRETGKYYVPSQNEEKESGFDIALVPALPRVWSSLTERLPGVGPGTVERVPRATSLFLQYKRPEFVSNRNGKQTAARDASFAAPVPYYRIELSRAQLKVLLALQATVAGRASVCYAAGLFHKKGDFYAHKLTSSVGSNSTFVRLQDVRRELVSLGDDPADPNQDHYWTYDRWGSEGLLCSEPRPLDGVPLHGMREGLREWVSEAEPVQAHVDRLTGGIQDWWTGFVKPERDRLRRELPERETPERELGAANAHQALDELGIGWFLAMPARLRQAG